MKFFKNKPLLITAIAVLLLFVLALASSGERTMTWFESTLGGIVSPVQTFVSNVSNSIVGFFENVFNTTDTDQENQQLKVYIAQLEQNLVDYGQLKQENARLKELLNYSGQAGGYEFVTATVIGKNQGIWFDNFTINAGRNHGIEKGAPVVCAQGLVGCVTDVGAGWAKVMAVLDARFSASVMVERTRDNGMAAGLLETGNEIDSLELYYLSLGSDLLPGDKIVTNGLGGGIYPKGILVGTVTEVTRQSDEVSRNAIVKSAVDFTRIEEVMVLTGGWGGQE